MSTSDDIAKAMAHDAELRKEADRQVREKYWLTDDEPLSASLVEEAKALHTAMMREEIQGRD